MKIRQLSRIAAAVAPVVFFALSPSANAVAPPSGITLEQLVLNPTWHIDQGDKRFFGFSYQNSGDMPDAADINVVGITSVLGNHGISFTGAPFVDLIGGGFSDAVIEYSVTVLDPQKSQGFRITDAHLDSNIDASGGTGQGKITETFTAVDPLLPPLNLVKITNFDIGPAGPSQLHDDYDWFASAPFASYLTIHVTKDILLASDTGSFVAVSDIDQTFSQTVVPVPAAIWGGLALMGLVIGKKTHEKLQLAE